ncbi:MAG: kelch repeat-containing protein [Planctomycetota bacterium]
MIRTQSFGALAAASVLMTTGVSLAQHFASPPEVDPRETKQVADPAFTIAKSVTSFGTATSDGWLYVLGGYTGAAHDYYSEGQSPDFYRINLYDFDHVESLPNDLRIQSAPLEAWNGKIIRVGGMVARNRRGEMQDLVSLDSVTWFDPQARAWSDLPSLPTPRSSHDSAIVGDMLYVIGGWTLDDSQIARPWAEDLLALDLSDPGAGWRKIPQPFERRAFATVALGDSIVALGGITSEGGMSQSVDVFDTTTRAWTSGPEFPSGAFGVAAEVADGRVYASGADGRVFSWAAGETAWTEVAALTFPRFFHQIARGMENDLFFLGGTSRGRKPIHVERIALEGSAVELPAVRHWTIPSPMAAKNRQGLFERDGWLYMFGGNNSLGDHDFAAANFESAGHRLSLATMSWHDLSDLPASRQSIQTVATSDGKSVLAIGGFAHDGSVARTFGQGFEFNLRSREWTEMGDVLPAPRSQYGLAEHDGVYWAFGGLDYDLRREADHHFLHRTAVLRAESSSGSVAFEETGIELPRPRRAFGGAQLDGRYYLVGGMGENFQLVERCDVFDFDAETFFTIPAPSRPRSTPELVALGGKLYLAGGLSPASDGSGLEPNPTIEVFDPETSSWSTLPIDLPVSPSFARVVPFRGRLLVVSSHSEDADLLHVVLIDPAKLDSAEGVRTASELVGAASVGR